MIERILLIMYISNTVSRSNFIFPMNDMFSPSNEPYNEHDFTKMSEARFSNPSPKRKHNKNASVYPNEMQMNKKSCWHLVTFLFHFYF